MGVIISTIVRTSTTPPPPTWSAPTQQQKLFAGDNASNDYFGWSVALNGNGDTVIVGAYNETTAPASSNGAAYVLTRSGSTWTQQAKLLANDKESSEHFGYAVAISSDGNTAAIGARYEGTSPTTQNGAVYIFTRSGGVWTQQAKLLASDKANTDRLGTSVAISGDGNTVIAGANGVDTPPYNNSNGAAYVFTRSGSTWSEQAKLLANDYDGADEFEHSVAITSDGNMAFVGARNEDTSPTTQNGAIYVFTRSGSTWTQQAKLLASDKVTNDQLGTSVATNSDGTTIIAGAIGVDSPTDRGAAYVFTRSGSTWTQEAKLLANDFASGDYFGNAVALNSDGNIAIVGAYYEGTPPTNQNGAGYIFIRSGSTWTQQAKLLASDKSTGDRLGTPVAISSSGDIAVLGAYQDDEAVFSNNGAAYVFKG